MKERDSTLSIMLFGKVRKFSKFKGRLQRSVAERGGTYVIIVDERAQGQSRMLYLWFALNPHNKTLLEFGITKGYSTLE